MKSLVKLRPSSRGSALLTVICLILFMSLLTGSILKYSVSERRANERNHLILRARNMSENISAYAAEQITTKLYRLRSFAPIAYMTGANATHLPPDEVLDNPPYTSRANGMEVRAGLTDSTGYVYIDPATNASSPNAGLQVNTANIPIIAKATVTHPAIGDIAAYTAYDLQVDMVPLFQFAMFYNMDLEISPGPDFTISGPVHTNGDLIARGQTGSGGNVRFLDRVSAAGGYYADTDHKGNSYSRTGVPEGGPGGTGNVFLQNPAGTITTIGTGILWRDHTWGTGTPTATTITNFKTFATSSYGVNFRTSAHNQALLHLPGVATYKEIDDTSTANDERGAGRQIIEPAHSADDAQMKETKIARRAGLYIIVNPDDDDRTGILPDATAVPMRARSYRCWLNTVNADLSHTMREVLLPGQPSYGALNANVNNLPNAYRTATSIGHNQILRTVQGGGADAADTGYTATTVPTLAAFDDAFFYDLRRALNNRGGAPYNRATYPYRPRAIVKIDFDMTRFRMMVERTMLASTSSSIYYPSLPPTSDWNASLFNPSATPANSNLGLGAPAFSTFPTGATLAAPDPYRLYFAPSNPADPRIATNPGTFAVAATDLSGTTTVSPWFDGITVYIHSAEAEKRVDTDNDGILDRIDSAVRLWNGRGPVVSLTTTGRTGLSFATNDAAYIVGHYNADGIINATTTATGTGGYSVRYPDVAAEMLCAVFADAITILSQPVFNNSYVQTNGWSDSLSSHRHTTGSYNINWQTTNPSGSNTLEGLDISKTPAALPNLSTPTAGTARTAKFGASTTEISTCVLMGIVPTNHNATGLTDGPPIAGPNNQSSGGVHNFPRLLDNWSGQSLYIRGSMVAMFESRVAMEAWNLRVYNAPSRNWGLHESLRTVNHDLPLEPILLSARRLRYKELTGTEYAARKVVIEALPR